MQRLYNLAAHEGAIGFGMQRQLLMRSSVLYFSLAYDANLFGFLNGCETVSNNQHGFSFAQFGKTFLNFNLVMPVERRGRFIKNQNRRIP